MPLVTLGAIVGKAVCSTPLIEVFYWIPCFSIVVGHDERGKPIPHLWHIASNLHPRVVCDGCMAARAERKARAASEMNAPQAELLPF